MYSDFHVTLIVPSDFTKALCLFDVILIYLLISGRVSNEITFLVIMINFSKLDL